MQPLNPRPGVPVHRAGASRQLRPVFVTAELPQGRQQHTGPQRNNRLRIPPPFALFPCRRECPGAPLVW
jgi:hypothetical protein